MNRKHSYPSGILRIALAYLNITFHIFFFLFARFIGYLSAMSVYFLLNWWKFSWLLDPRWWLESASPDWRGVPAIDLVNWHLPVLDCYAICGEGERGCWCWSLCESKYLMRRGVDRVKQCSAVNACVWEIIWGSTVSVHLCRLACSVTCLTKTTPCPFFLYLVVTLSSHWGWKIPFNELKIWTCEERDMNRVRLGAACRLGSS